MNNLFPSAEESRNETEDVRKSRYGRENLITRIHNEIRDSVQNCSTAATISIRDFNQLDVKFVVRELKKAGYSA